jgi:hypothetical protein
MVREEFVMIPHQPLELPTQSRRDLLQRGALGFGWLALGGLTATESARAEGEVRSRAALPPGRGGKAKRVIFLCMRGGPSHLDLFDHKPKLLADSGKPGPSPGSKLLGSKWRFQRHGRSGLYVSELLPEIARHADRLCLIPSMQTVLPAHPQAFIKLHTGTAQFVRPSLGAWTLYGLGMENRDLPGFVSITPPSGFGGVTNYGSSFLPATYQGTRIGQDSRPIASATVPNLRSKDSAEAQRAELDFVQSLNRRRLARAPDPEVEGAIESLELAFRMQSRMPAVTDLERESAATRALYGIGAEATDDMGRKCLLARRLVEAGVRFVEISHGNWDHHFKLNANLETSCREVDRPIAGLLADLAGRGLLEETLVVWTGEFGRTPHAEGPEGRDHNVRAFTLWMAGGGVRAGITHGRSDDYGYQAVEHPVPIVDLHATMLALLGLDHEKLTWKHAGRDFRLTDVHGHVIREIIA